MSRIFFKSAALPVVAFCWAVQCAGPGMSTAQAGCGDYVHLGGIDSPNIIPGMATSSMQHARPVGSRERSVPPCRGPHCRQVPATPDAPAPAEPVGGPDQKACLAWHDLPVLACEHTLLVGSTVCLEEFPHGRIDRPPRNRG